MSSEPPIRPENASSPNDFPPPAPRSKSALPIVLIVGGVGCLVSLPVIGILIALLLPAVQVARGAAEQSQSKNNMKIISLAISLHDAQKGRLPPRAILDEDGQPLLSWRVAILPYIEEQALYGEFHLDEPWDSPHNRPLADRMPVTYLCPGSDDIGPQTHYQVPVGEGTPFEGDEGLSYQDFRDGMSDTILVVEADEGVIWTKPDDWTYDPSNPTNGVGNVRRGGFIVLFADGRVLTLQNDIDPEVLRALITHDGGEAVSAGAY